MASGPARRQAGLPDGRQVQIYGFESIKTLLNNELFKTVLCNYLFNLLNFFF